jgi:hypothetical protein
MTTTPILQDPDRLAELMTLLGGADSVELKLTIPDHRQRSAAEALDLDPLNAQIRQVVFFDTPSLDLNQSGLVVRARRIQGGSGDTVVKLRPVVPDDIDDDMRGSGDLGVEVDAMPGGFVCSASMKGKGTAKAIRRVVGGRAEVKTLFSKPQKRFFHMYAPDGMKLSDLSVLGPINILKLKFGPPELGRKMVAELWLYPDGTRALELSTKCGTDEAFHVAVETRAFLSERGIDLEGEQAMKTKTALEFFAAGLAHGNRT